MSGEREAAPLLVNASINNDGEEGGKAGVFGSIVNLTNTIIGAGLLAIPYAFRMSGMAMGLIFLVMICCVSGLSFDSLARSAQFTRVFTYKEIALKTWGPSLALVSELFILLYTFLNLVARPIILAEYIVTVFEIWIDGYSVFTQRWFIIIMVSILVFPLTALRNIDPLKYSSFFSLICVIFTSVVVVVMFALSGDIPEKVAHAHSWPDSVSALMSFGIMVVSFCAHYNAPRMYQELQARSIRKFRVVIGVSMGICLILYSVVGVTGYLSCLFLTEGNVLDDYAGSNILVTVARLALVFALIFSTPLVLFACRRSFLVVFLPRMAKEPPFWLWVLISGVILILTGIIAYLLPKISVIFGFSGALVGVAFVFFIPGLFFVLIARRKKANTMLALSDHDFVESGALTEQGQKEANFSPKVIMVTGVFLMCFAVVVCVLGTAGSVFQVIRGDNSTMHCANFTLWNETSAGQVMPLEEFYAEL